MRVDHWIKNVFVVPGAIVALSLDPDHRGWALAIRALLALLATGLVASSNYTLNEILDAPFDQHHPLKNRRPVPNGQVAVPIAYAQWIVLGVLGIGLGAVVSPPIALSLAALWVMGCVYNVPPVRSKDVPYLDVLSEAVNNPIRMLVGWYIVSDRGVPPASLLLSYWMVGCFFMAIKRFAEIKNISDTQRLAAYRRSLAFFDEPRMLVAIMFYAAASMLFFGAFIVRYRLELILTFPVVALVMALYLSMAFKPESAAQHPEKLYRQPALMAGVSACFVLMVALLFIDLPGLRVLFDPTIPNAAQQPVGKAAPGPCLAQPGGAGGTPCTSLQRP